MSIGTLISRILGLVRETVFAAFFDRFTTDVFVAAFRIPNLFRRLLGEGSLSIGFIPVFVEILGGRGRTGEFFSAEAHKLASAIFSILLVILMTLTVLGIVFMEPIVNIMVGGEGYLDVPGKTELTVHLARIMFGFIFFISLFAFLMAILNSLGKFAMAAIAPAFMNVSLIIAAFLPKDQFVPGEILAWAALIGGAIQAGVLIPQVVRSGYFPHWSCDWRSYHVRRVLLAIAPSLLGMSIIQITAVINTRFASQLPEGSISWLYWADRVIELPLSLFAVSLGTAILPTLSHLWSSGNKKLMSDTLTLHLRLIFFLAIPAAVALYMLAPVIVDVLFHYGRFSDVDAAYTTQILHVYAFMLLAASGVRVVAPAFYAIKNTWLPALVAVSCLVFHIIMANLLIARFGLPGLASSSFLSATLNFVLLTVFYAKFIGYLQFNRFIKSLGKFIMAGAVVAALFACCQPLIEMLVPGKIFKIFLLFGFLLCGGLIYLVMSYVLGCEEVQMVFRRFLHKTKTIN